MRYFLLLIMALKFSFLNTAYAASPYKHFDDYIEIQMLFSPSGPNYCSQQALRCIYEAKEKSKSRVDNPLYDENKWFLILRHSLYQAQVEKAMSEIYAYFMGYATDVDIVENQGDYYIASRSFKDFVDFAHFHPVGSQIQEVAKGFGEISALADFFGDGDFASDNFGVQITGQNIKAIKIDNADALTFEDNDQNKEDMENDIGGNPIGQEIINSQEYKNAKKTMLAKIATTDFSVIETIIRKNITQSRLDQLYWEADRFYYGNDEEKAKYIKLLQQYDPKGFEVDAIVETLRQRQVLLNK